MADLTVTAAQVAAVFPNDARIRSKIAVESLTRGDAVYYTTAGKAGKADANVAGKQQFRGIALETVGSGQAVDVLEDGEVYGFTLSGVNHDALIYLSDTAGKLADAAGTMTVQVGRVAGLSDADITKTIRVFADPMRQWS